MKTIVLQSQARSKIVPWVRTCLGSVEHWAQIVGADYRFVDDALFELLAPWVREKLGDQAVVASDLARLRLMQAAYGEGYGRAIWIDADVLIFDPMEFTPTNTVHAVGREVWVQLKDGKPRAFRKVHNAYLMAMGADSFLPFYADAAETMLEKAEMPVVPQFIGPKFLTALHNMMGLAVEERVGMLSPLALKDVVAGGGEALDLTLSGHEAPLAAVNLSASYVGRESDGVMNDEAAYEKAVEALMAGVLAA